jgi:hypothetical protein
MDLGIKCRHGNVIQWMQRLAKQQLPDGAIHHKVPKAGMWQKPRAPRVITRHFDLFGPCTGKIEDVMELGLELARDAIAAGNRQYAERVLARLKRLPLEHQRDQLVRQLKRA